ncbi:hypothetical protein Dfer_4514 [Dyadobacter fermentans DSM 18053]|uniref:Uncharacterized protein n=1 Tax=Dyadobacter fermentans (strain ATCC 700827 / DSM 18053 / CIP 107007 / KCTC 52180 / NS114) TaxID=471854 RepID=C6W302_DYAFD|nr:hypothetical protein Dfer_4514 [Dyadobacter fermentans DSM 18053]
MSCNKCVIKTTVPEVSTWGGRCAGRLLFADGRGFGATAKRVKEDIGLEKKWDLIESELKWKADR